MQSDGIGIWCVLLWQLLLKGPLVTHLGVLGNLFAGCSLVFKMSRFTGAEGPELVGTMNTSEEAARVWTIY